MQNERKIKALLHRVGLLTGLPDNEVEKIVSSQYEFIKKAIEVVNFKEIQTKEQLEELRTNFVLKYLGKLYTNFSTLQSINNRSKKSKQRKKTNENK
tara:strand:- start:3928 stop:4218 length:291 start_codon:yes stop_codon:yes gene_type:complete